MPMKVIDMMMKMGLGREVATLAIPYMWSTPNITDRYSTQTISIVKGLQKKLGLPQTGQIDEFLDTELKKRVCPAWRSYDWVDIYRAVLEGKPKRARPELGFVPTGGVQQSVAAEGGSAGAGWNWLDSALAWYKQTTADAAATGPLVEESGGGAEWCSDTHPAGSCTPIKGVAKPMTANAVSTFKLIQTTGNRIAEVKGYPKVAVDGRIGPATVSLVNRCLGSSYASPDGIASTASLVVSQLTSVANQFKAPAVVASPVPRNPSMPAPSGGAFNPKPSIIGDALGFAMSPVGLMVLGGAVIWKMQSGGKKGSKSTGWF